MFQGLEWVFAVILVWALLFGFALGLARFAAREHDNAMAVYAERADSHEIAVVDQVSEFPPTAAAS